MKKNSFLSFASACVPGCGQMYQGYFKRGISILAWFFGISIISAMFNLGALAILMFPIWLFAFFDSYSLRNLTPQQRVLFPDDFVPPSKWAKENVSVEGLKGKGGKILGWGFIILGVVFIYNTVLLPFVRNYIQLNPYINELIWRMPDIIFAAAIIGAGVFVLTRNKPQQSEAPPQTGEQQPTEEKTPFINMPPAAFVAAQPQNSVHVQQYVPHPQNPNAQNTYTTTGTYSTNNTQYAQPQQAAPVTPAPYNNVSDDTAENPNNV